MFMSPTDVLIRETVDIMVSNGFVTAGYKYLNLDDGIVELDRDANGDLVADLQGFPNGFKATSDYVHERGMLFGVYTDRGTTTCGGRAGALGHEAADAAFYARNGIDYVKEDSCNAVDDPTTGFHEYSLMRDALNATGRSIFFSLCGWHDWYSPVCAALGNSCRIGPDDINWHGVLRNIDDMAPLYSYAGPGGFNDPCLLLGTSSNGKQDVTDLQGRAQFTMWAMLAAPMLISSNIRNLTAYQTETYLSGEAIAVGQDVKGHQAQRVAGGNMTAVTYSAAGVRTVTLSAASPTSTWLKQLASGSYAIAAINPGPVATTNVSCDFACLTRQTGWTAGQLLTVRDVWAKIDLPNITAGAGWTVNTPLDASGGHVLQILTPLF